MELMSTKVCDYRWLWKNKPGAINHQSLNFWKHYRFWFVFFSVPNFQPLTCNSKVSLFSWRKRRKMNCLIRYPCDSEKYEKNNLTYHSWITPCGVIKQNCMEYWYEPAESDSRLTKRKKTEIIHKQSLKRDGTRNLTLCEYYCFSRKFCFVLALKSDEMFKSLCSGKVCIWRENVIFMRFRRVGSRKFR